MLKINIPQLVFLILFLFFTRLCEAASSEDLVVSGSIIDAAALSQGGKLSLTSFKPGPGAEANELTDNISLNMMRGIKDALAAYQTPLTITEGDAADFMLDGYIEEITQSGKFARLILRQKQTALSVDGEIWSQASGTKAFVFSSAIVINTKKEPVLDAAYRMGRSVGDYIGTHLSEKLIPYKQ